MPRFAANISMLLTERPFLDRFADPPGRHAPGTGAIDSAPGFAAIDETGYDGWAGAEYTPSRATEETLEWFAPYRDA